MKRTLTVLFLLLSNIAFGFQEKNNPIAKPEAVVTEGNARFTILSPHLIRMEWVQDGQFQDQASFVVLNRNLPVPSFSRKKRGRILTITTEALTLTYKRGKTPFSKENLSITYKVGGAQKEWLPGLKDDQNLKGTARTLDGANGGKHWDGKPIELEDGLV